MGCVKRIFSPICSMKADLGIIFQNFDAYGLPNAYFRTAKYLTMMKNTIETKWGMPFFSTCRVHMIWCAFNFPDPGECFKYPHHGSVTNRTCYTDSQSCNSQLLSSSSLWPIQMIEISENFFSSKIEFLTSKMIFFLIFFKTPRMHKNWKQSFFGMF